MMMEQMMEISCSFGLQEDHYDSYEDNQGVAILVYYHEVEHGDDDYAVVRCFVTI